MEDVHTWHVAFPGFLWFLLLFAVFFGFRRRWWWGYPPYGRSWPYRRYWRPEDEQREWEEWHRREHERMDARGRDSRGPGTPVA